MSDRTDPITKDELGQIITDMQADVRKLNNAQYIGGGSVRFYQSDSGAAYDWGGLLPQSPQAADAGGKVLVVEATAVEQDVLFADLIWELYSPTSSNLWTIREYLAALKAGNFLASFVSPFKVSVDVDEQNKARWGIAILGDKVTNNYIKFYVVANDTVSLSVTQVN